MHFTKFPWWVFRAFSYILNRSLSFCSTLCISVQVLIFVIRQYYTIQYLYCSCSIVASCLLVFTAHCYASAVLAMALCLSVCLSVTSRSSTKTAKRRITQTTPHDSPGTLVYGCQRSHRDHPLRGRQIQVGWVKIGDFRQIAGYILKTVQDRRMVSIKVE